MSNPESSPEQPKLGVLSHRIEHREYIVSIRWKDGQESELHMPVNGFDVIDPETHQRLGRLEGDDALQALIDHAAETTREQFDWRNFLDTKETDK